MEYIFLFSFFGTQDKRNDREVERLFKIIEHSTDIDQSQLDRTIELGNSQLPNLKVKVDEALSMCERVLQKEGKINHVCIKLIISQISFVFFSLQKKKEKFLLIIIFRKMN